MKRYFAYIRVSTAKQGEHGSSLQEQRSAIESYARKQNLTVARWYEEVETAAKLGRRVFSKMLTDQRRELASGIIIHKIDRSARNLKDWAAIGDLIDQGVEVHFAHESLDMRSRGGRLAADVQAVVAADYIRNLRDEVKKGLYGRLKQGLYPLPAPVGYLDRGGGKVKDIDPALGPIVVAAFELYDSGLHSLISLREELHRLGLRNRRGGRFSRSGLANVLHNSFYCGLIRIRRTNELFEGTHTPLISKSLFDRVQRRLAGKTNQRVRTHDFLLRRLLRCATCSATLTGEKQKGHIYYRCHARACAGTSIREERFLAEIRSVLATIQLDDRDLGDFIACIDRSNSSWQATREAQIIRLRSSIVSSEQRLNRLTDAFLDGEIERDLFHNRKQAILGETVSLRNQLSALERAPSVPERLRDYFELAKSALLTFDSGDDVEKRDVLKQLTSNLAVNRKYPVVALRTPFREIADEVKKTNGAPCQATFRTDVEEICARLEKCVEAIEQGLDGSEVEVPRLARRAERMSNHTELAQRP